MNREKIKLNNNLINKLSIRKGYSTYLVNVPIGFYEWISPILPTGNRLQLGYPSHPSLAVIFLWPENLETISEALSWISSNLIKNSIIWLMAEVKKSEMGNIGSIDFKAIEEMIKKTPLKLTRKTLQLDKDYGIQLLMTR